MVEDAMFFFLLEALKLPFNGIAFLGDIVFRADIGLFAVDVESPELTITGFCAVDGVDEPLGGDVNLVSRLEQF